MIANKIPPFLGHKRVNKITVFDILNWENELMSMSTDNGLEYSQTHLDSIRNQPCAMLNHAVRYYGLASNPMTRADKSGLEAIKAFTSTQNRAKMHSAITPTQSSPGACW